MHARLTRLAQLANLLLPLLLLATDAAFPGAAAAKPDDAILLSGVRTLTLRAGRATSHRRVAAVPQLRCVSAPRVCALHEVDVMRCANQGSSYGPEDVEWSCTASLPPELKLGATDVVCEGYARPDDPYVLRGSCGVEYRLVLTDLGERRFPDIANAGSGGDGGWFSGWGPGKESGGGGVGGGDSGWDLGSSLFSVIFVGVLLWIIYSAWTQANLPAAARGRPRNRWFGGGGWGGFDPGFGPGGGGGGGGGGGYGGGYGGDAPPPYSKYSSSSRQNQGNWRPGFWSGLAGGAAAGYLAGNRGGRQQEPRNSYESHGSGGGSWNAPRQPRPPSSSWGSGEASTSVSRYTSTGFGSTSRR
ncbi:putative transmembrane protein [Rosellinia necatrix]|uniref:Store-operated calcium entry-associated regulatory factor n=1 Tax=Rosellinia necatrix TaxID=77044 RepID=A0A1W2TH33_ROSNE|nr:putative transmembrane protein [Rosellinia necatrix]